MRSIAILNQKGGVGKTTTAVNLSAALARSGKRVLLIDLDPQSHATMHLGIELEPSEPTIYDVLTQGMQMAATARGVSEQLVMIPANVDLVGAELELAPRADRELALSSAVRPYRDGFDFCIVDCPPSLGLLTVNALASVEEIVIPLQAHFLALQGLGRLLQTVLLVRESLNPSLRIAGVVLCMFEQTTRLAQEVRDDVARFLEQAQPDSPWYGARVFDTTIRRNIKLAECPSFGQTVFDYAPACHGAEDYAALAEELLRAGDEPGSGPDASARSPTDELQRRTRPASDAGANAAPAVSLPEATFGEDLDQSQAVAPERPGREDAGQP